VDQFTDEAAAYRYACMQFITSIAAGRCARPAGCVRARKKAA
jgi:hypothetical protein